jgi:hypothetical protein
MRFSGACALSLAVALTLGVASAQPDPGEAFTLAELMKRLAASRGVAARFRESKEIGILAEPLTSRGLLYFVPPDRMARFTTHPGFSALVIDGASVRFRDAAEGEELDLSRSPVARVFVDHFIVLFNGDLERLQRLYETSLAWAGPRWTLMLTPRDAPLDQFLEGVTLRGDGGGLREIQVRDRDGDRTTTVFDEVVPDQAFSAAELEMLFTAGVPLDGAPTRR